MDSRRRGNDETAKMPDDKPHDKPKDPVEERRQRIEREFAEREAKALGIHRIELNVFGGNTVARNLYRSLGYVERAVQMGKDLA